MVGLGFTRIGADGQVVISDAVKRGVAALPDGARLREVKPDLVSLADVATRLRVSRQTLQKREMLPLSLSGLFRASEMLPMLETQPGKVRDALDDALGWFASAAAAQRINARVAECTEAFYATLLGCEDLNDRNYLAMMWAANRLAGLVAEQRPMWAMSFGDEREDEIMEALNRE